MEKIRVIYVTGYGRSGSTMLDISLAQHPGIFGAGELLSMGYHVWDNDEYCACGERIRSCPTWAPIMGAWMEAGNDVASYRALQRRIEPLYAPDRLMRTGALARYHEATATMFGVISKAAGGRIIVDSSKAPGRGLALAANPAIDLKVVHLVRDARAVANSMAKEIAVDVEKGVQKHLRAKPAIRTALRWRMYNAMAERLGRAVGQSRFVRVRYEDFATQPRTEFDRIGAAVGVDLGDVGARLQAREPVSPSHQMAGSRIRMKGDLVVRVDSAWRDAMPEHAKAQVRAVAGEQLARYGYFA